MARAAVARNWVAPSPSPARRQTLTVVGFGNSVTSTADGWVTPGEITRLQARAGRTSAQMLYRFIDAASYAQVRADVAEVTRRCRRAR